MSQITEVNVFVIVVTYNAEKWIQRCINSVSRSQIPVTMILVDNMSSDDTISLCENRDTVEIIRLNSNIGFGRANNVGISYALQSGADYVFLLNQDAHIETDTIETLIEIAQTDTSYGILSPVHLNKSGSDIDRLFIQHILNYGGQAFFSDLYLNKDLKPVYPVAFLNAAGWLLRREFLLTVGGFDPLFFMYGEDDDLCYRAAFHGFKVGLVPKVHIHHYREHSPSPLPPKKAQAFSMTNRLYSSMILDMKHSARSLSICVLRLTLVTLLDVCRMAIGWNIKNGTAILKAYSKILRSLPEIDTNRRMSKIHGAHWLNIDRESAV